MGPILLTYHYQVTMSYYFFFFFFFFISFIFYRIPPASLFFFLAFSLLLLSFFFIPTPPTTVFFFSFFFLPSSSSSFFFFLSFFLYQTHSPCSSTHKYIPRNRNPLLIFVILVFVLRIPGFRFRFSVFMGLGWQFWITDLKILCWCVWVFYVCSCGWSLGCDGGEFVWLVVVLMIGNFFFLWV